MKNVKRIFGLVGVLLFAVLLIGNVQAQGIGNTGPAGTGGTVIWDTARLPLKVLTNGTSSAYNTNTVYLGANTKALFQMNFQSSGACTSNLTVQVYKSIDGANWEAYYKFEKACVSTTPQTLTTNLDVTGAARLKWEVSTTALTSAPVTNSTLRYFLKP